MENISLNLPESVSEILKITVSIKSGYQGDHDKYIIRGGITHFHAWEQLKSDYNLSSHAANYCMGGYLTRDEDGVIVVSSGSDSHRDIDPVKIARALELRYPERKFKASQL